MKINRLYTLFIAVCMAAGTQAQGSDTPKYSNDGRHKGLDFSIMTGYHAGVGDFKNMGSIPVEIGLGKQFHPNLYVGLGSGVWIGTEEGSKPMVPITADAKLMFPLKSTQIKPIFTVRLGYLLNTAGDVEGGTQEYEGIQYESAGYDAPDFIMMEIMPGVQLPVSKSTDFMISAGYTHGFASKGGGGGGYFTVKAGLNFHKNPNKIKLGPKREKVPTRNKGLQFTLEALGNFGGFDMGFGGNLVCTYKLNPHFSVGGGIGYETYQPFCMDEFSHDPHSNDIQVIRLYDEVHGEEFYDYYGSVNSLNIFARGVYRIIDRRFSPFVSVDAGVGMVSYDGELMRGYDNVVEAPSKVTPFVSPAVGLSIRTTKNSYIDVKAGYTFATGPKAQKSYSEDTYVSTATRNMTKPFVSLGFTHTFGKRGKRLR